MKARREIAISQNSIRTLKGHARKEQPNESCAVLFGKSEGSCFSVTGIFLVENSLHSPVSFAISSDDLIRAYRELEARKLEVTAIFHSHPDSEAYPSPIDLKYMEINPVPWLIYSNTKDELKAYILESEVVPVTVRVR
ncbi:MAG: M67 family metallopeptidase [Thaumarchaeota archaeon]|nr:M67 family metallopeptidase [Nitrososphaerota archaeon]